MVRYLNGEMGQECAHALGYPEIRREAPPRVEYMWPSGQTHCEQSNVVSVREVLVQIGENGDGDA